MEINHQECVNLTSVHTLDTGNEQTIVADAVSILPTQLDTDFGLTYETVPETVPENFLQPEIIENQEIPATYAQPELAQNLPQSQVSQPEQEIHEQNEIENDENAENITRPKKRRRTEEEQIKFNKEAHPLLDPCLEKCRQKCFTKFEEEERSQINANYWSLSYEQRRLWLDGNLEISPVQRRSANLKEFTRNNSVWYYLPKDNLKMQVCKTMFLRTLGMKSDRMVFDFISAKSKNAAGGIGDIIKDKRGLTSPGNKKDWDSIRNHISSYNPQVSHYRLEQCPNRRYLEPHLNIRSMWNDYHTTHNDVSYHTYRRVFESENIGFGVPSQDDCDICTKFFAHEKNVANDDDHNKETCPDCVLGKDHLDRARIARHEYKKDNTEAIPENCAIFTADMQKIVLLPKMTTKEHFFVSRLVVFNETFASLDGKNDLVILWHEAIAGRLACNVASAYVKCITLSEKEKLVFWVDNCTAQNKNWVLFSALAWCVNQEWGPQSIVIKYLEKGHTFMRADSVHGKIGSKMGKTSNVYNFQDFVDICNESGKGIKPVCMELADFFQFTDGHRSRQTKKVVIPQLSDMSVVEFRKGSRSLFHKRTFADEFNEVDFLKVKFKLNVEPEKQQTPRGIKVSKKNGILKLIQSFPPSKKKFWFDIPENNESSDLVHQFE